MPDGGFDRFSRADIDDWLAQFGYSPDEEPFYSMYGGVRPGRRHAGAFMIDAIAKQLLRDYRANDIGNMRRDINAGMFCGYIPLRVYSVR